MHALMAIIPYCELYCLGRNRNAAVNIICGIIEMCISFLRPYISDNLSQRGAVTIKPKKYELPINAITL